jgi:hypothetical protein
MALLDTDQIAVWRNGEQKNYVASVTQLMTRVPAPTPDTLTAVLKQNNTSDGVDIIVDNDAGSEVVKLSASGTNFFTNSTVFNTEVQVGATAKILLKSAGDIYGVETGLIGDTTTGNALRVYAAGTTIDNLNAGTGTATVTITNAGVATFAGALEALSIDGGTYS